MAYFSVHNLKFSNFFSFEEETEISFVLDGHSRANGRSFNSCASDRRLSKVLAIFGANGSGKTNLIKPFSFLAWFISDSFRSEIDNPITVPRHFFSKSKESNFEIEFEVCVDDRAELFIYRLRVSDGFVLGEELHRKTSKKFSYVFLRDWNKSEKSYSVRQKDFGFPAKELKKIRRNASLISTAAQYGVPMASEIVESLNIYTNVNALGRNRRATDSSRLGFSSKFYAENERHRKRMVSLIKKWDFGLEDIVVEREISTLESGETKELYVPYGVHTNGSVTVKLPLLAESSGTQGAFILLARLLEVLETGGIATVDELESDLHPLMIEPILDLFFDEKSNSHNAQVIFTSHTIETMSLLQKAQIMLVEKDDELRSHAWTLADMDEVRADDNFYAKYLAGAYGAIPRL